MEPISKKEDKKMSFKRSNSRDGHILLNRDGENDASSQDNSILPRHLQNRLHHLFTQIEEEFVEIHAENLELRKTVTALNEKLSNGDAAQWTAEKNENNHTNGSDLQKGKGKSSQISQRLKTTYKTGTSKLVSSFKPASNVQCRVLREFRGHRDGVWDVASSPVSSSLAGSASADQKAKLWNLHTGECVATYHGHVGSVNCIRFHGDKQLVLTVSGDASAHIWPYEHRRATSSDEESLDRDDSAEEIANGESHDYRKPLMRANCHTSPVVSCDWLMDGQHFVTASWDRTSCLVDSASGQTVQTLSGHDLPLTHVSAHSRQKLIVTSSRDATFRVCDFRVPAVHTVIVGQGHTQSVLSAVFTNDDKIVSSSEDRYLKIWDLKSMRAPLASLRFSAAVNRLAVSRRGVIAMPHDNRQIRLYDTSGNRLARLPRNDRFSHSRVVTAATWVEGSNPRLLTCGWDKLMISWEVDFPHSSMSLK